MKVKADPMCTYNYWLRMSGFVICGNDLPYAHHAGLSVDFMLYTALTAWMEAQ